MAAAYKTASSEAAPVTRFRSSASIVVSVVAPCRCNRASTDNDIAILFLSSASMLANTDPAPGACSIASSEAIEETLFCSNPSNPALVDNAFCSSASMLPVSNNVFDSIALSVAVAVTPCFCKSASMLAVSIPPALKIASMLDCVEIVFLSSAPIDADRLTSFCSSASIDAVLVTPSFCRSASMSVVREIDD